MEQPRLRLALAVALLCVSGATDGADKLWIVTGEVYKDNYYVSLGTVIPLPRSTLGHGWVQRYWADAYTYSYQSGSQQIDANVWGAEALLGYQGSRPGLSGAAYLGLRYTNTALSPPDPTNNAQGGQVHLKAQVEGAADLSTRWRTDGIAAFTFSLNDYWTRARLLRSLQGTKYVGAEVVFQGNPDYSAQEIGVLLGGLKPFGKTFVTVKAGYRFQSGANSPYAGLEIVGEY